MEDHDFLRKSLRRDMGERRAALRSDQIADYSRLISNKLGQLEPLIKANSIMGYAGIGNEVNLDFYWEEQASLGKTIYLPRVESNGVMTAVQFTGWQNTRRGAFDIREPVGVGASDAAIDVVIVPGLVFDGHGFRLGYGKGYYDRYLPRLAPNTFICGVCYDFQVVDNVFPHTDDVPMHWIVTEKSEVVINWSFF